MTSDTEMSGRNTDGEPPTLHRAASTAHTWRALRLPGPNEFRNIDPGSVPRDFAVTNLDFDLTENCNLQCLYCFKGDTYPRSMSLHTMKRAFEWLILAAGSASAVHCNFMGGEPTMRFKQIKRFVPWARRRGRAAGKQVTFSMTTNLVLLTEEIRKFVDHFGFGVMMSIDGCPEVQDAQRPSRNGRRVSQIVERWARSLLSTRPRSTARATVHPDYVERLIENIRYLHLLGFREVTLSASEYALWTHGHFSELRTQLQRVSTFAQENYERGQPFTITSWKYYTRKLIDPIRRGRGDALQPERQPCGAGKGYMMIDYTGDVWPCHRFDGADAAAGAGGAMRLANIFEPGFNQPLRRAFLDYDHTSMKKGACANCAVNRVCGGYCPAANLSDTGSIYTPHDNYCRWSQLMYAVADDLYQRLASVGGDAFELYCNDAKK